MRYRVFLTVLIGAIAALAAIIAPDPLVAAGLAMALGWLGIGPAQRIGARTEEAGQPPVSEIAPPPEREETPLGPGGGLIEKFPAPLLVISRNGRLTYANAAAQRALPRADSGTHFAHIIRAPAFVEAIGATLQDGGDRSFQFTAFDSRERIFEARVSLLRDRDTFGADLHALVQIEDRTKEHRAEQSRSDFIANASHELRTPLASIIGYIETLQNHAREDPDARERFLEIMAREAARMQRLVDDLMSLSRIEMNEHDRPDEIVSLNAIAADCATVFQPLAAKAEITLKVDLDTGGGMVKGDRDQLAQVFTNLIDNATKYSGPGTEVSVFAAPESKAHPNRCGVSVSDTGPGIPRDKLHRLTERFYRVNVSQSRNKGGTGLGLAIVKHILNRHRGRIEITSTPGEGSTFTVWLPCAAEALGARVDAA